MILKKHNGFSTIEITVLVAILGVMMVAILKECSGILSASTYTFFFTATIAPFCLSDVRTLLMVVVFHPVSRLMTVREKTRCVSTALSSAASSVERLLYFLLLSFTFSIFPL